jgi:di/tricarboxylate transporter
VALVVDVATYLVCRWWFADSFAAFAEAVKQEFAVRRRAAAAKSAALATVGAGNGGGGDVSQELQTENSDLNALDGTYFNAEAHGPADDPETRKAYRLSWIILTTLILLLVTHGTTERWLGHLFQAQRISADGSVEHHPDGSIVYGLREGTMMVAAALIMGCVVLLLMREHARELVERRVDWWTLAFFMMLFASVGTLQDTRVTQVIADKMSGAGGSQFATIQIIGWTTGWLSAFLDNVLAVATFMPVVHDIRLKAGVPYSSSVYWFMLFGGTFMGNMTIIGSTANIVAVGLLERRGHGTIKFGYWMKIGFIVSIVSMVVATAVLVALDHLAPGGIPKLAAPTAAVP